MSTRDANRYKRIYSYFQQERSAPFDDSCVCGVIRLHDTSYDPIGLWQFQESLVDSSGNGFDFTLASGSQRYAEVVPGVRALLLFNNNKYVYNVTGSLLAVTGNITIEALVSLNDYPTAINTIVAYEGPGADIGTQNALYRVDFNNNELRWFSESGAGVDATFSSARSLGIGQLCHLAVRRESNVVQFFGNGTPIGNPSSALTTPASGSSSILWLGGPAAFTPSMALLSLKIVPSALTNQQIKDEYNLTLGDAYGTI